jgi:Flp pilus assembly protein TadD
LINVLPCIRTATALAAVAIVVAGCAAANNATSAQASAQGEQPYKTMYGMTSEGTTTDLYTEIFGPRQPPPTAATNVASAQPAEPVTAQPITPVQQGTTMARPAQTATATNRQGQTTAANRAPQPAYGQPAPVQPVQVAQQPAPPAPPPEPDAPAAYGITANGPTTDLYTEIFGPRHSNSQ